MTSKLNAGHHGPLVGRHQLNHPLRTLQLTVPVPRVEEITSADDVDFAQQIRHFGGIDEKVLYEESSLERGPIIEQLVSEIDEILP